MQLCRIKPSALYIKRDSFCFKLNQVKSSQISFIAILTTEFVRLRYNDDLHTKHLIEKVSIVHYRETHFMKSYSWYLLLRRG